MERFARATLLAGVLVTIACLPLRAAYQKGDIFASVGNGLIRVYTSAGVLKQTLDTAHGGGTGASAFDSRGNFYVIEDLAAIRRFDSSGVPFGTFGTFGPAISTPINIQFDASGNAFIGNLDEYIGKYKSSGKQLSYYDIPLAPIGLDLNASETIAYFTGDEFGTIHRLNLTNNNPVRSRNSNCLNSLVVAR